MKMVGISMKIFLCSMILIWAISEVFQSIRKYRKSKEKVDLISLIASIVMIPSGLILLIGEFVG